MEWNILVADAQGRTVLRQTVPGDRSSSEVDLRGQPSGVYTARIENGNEVLTRKLVLQR